MKKTILKSSKNNNKKNKMISGRSSLPKNPAHGQTDAHCQGCYQSFNECTCGPAVSPMY